MSFNILWTFFSSGQPIDFNTYNTEVPVPIIESFPDDELDQYFPNQYNPGYGQSSVPCTTVAWSTTNYQRIAGSMSHSSYSVAQTNDISSPYDLSNHPSPASNSQSMHSPSYQNSGSDCKYPDEDRSATIKLEPARQRQNPRQFETYDVSPPPPRYPVEHTNYSSTSPNSYPTTTASGSPTYQYLNVARQIYNPAIPAAVPADQQWNRYTWTCCWRLHTFMLIFIVANIYFVLYHILKMNDWLISLHFREWEKPIVCVFVYLFIFYKVGALLFMEDNSEMRGVLS